MYISYKAQDLECQGCQYALHYLQEQLTNADTQVCITFPSWFHIIFKSVSVCQEIIQRKLSNFVNFKYEDFIAYIHWLLINFIKCYIF